ncbi:hypothetical protein C1Y30_19780 [Pseudomonas sp. GW704-F3]|nr:hypothetical protein C1Y30_19780 [Pseudomonas sp. GW704-F3]PMU88697.1 hypothetical protein C1Y28_28225 [Pseudomonas sp. GW704-F5]PMV21021.1 hypothetical protein C1Y27_27950 [Pseudomonas sp. GW704-F2]
MHPPPPPHPPLPPHPPWLPDAPALPAYGLNPYSLSKLKNSSPNSSLFISILLSPHRYYLCPLINK